MAKAMILELVPFLKDSKMEVRLIAARQIKELTADATVLSGLGLTETSIVANLASLLGDHRAISKEALICLINLCGEADLIAQMLGCHIIKKVMENLKSGEEVGTELYNLNCMLLGNVSMNAPGAESMMQMEILEGKLKGLYAMQLIQWFITGAVVGGKEDQYQYIANILMNITQLGEGRELICDQKKNILSRLLPQLRSTNPIRRKGIAGMIKNCCLDKDLQPFLLYSHGLKLVENIMYVLHGPEALTEKDLEGLDPLVTRDGSQKKRESDLEIIKLLVEGLNSLGRNYKGRTELRRVKLYPIIKVMHLALQEVADEELMDQIFVCVDLLMGAERDGLADMHKPEGARNDDFLTTPLKNAKPLNDKGVMVTADIEEEVNATPSASVNNSIPSSANESAQTSFSLDEEDSDLDDMPELV